MPGNNVSAKTIWYFPGNTAINQRAVSGPTMAPSVSMARSKPKGAAIDRTVPLRQLTTPSALACEFRVPATLRRERSERARPWSPTQMLQLPVWSRDSRQMLWAYAEADHRYRTRCLIWQAGQPIGDTFNDSKPCSRHAQRAEECWQNRGRDFMAPVTEKRSKRYSGTVRFIHRVV
jgi:hypothetical protein